MNKEFNSKGFDLYEIAHNQWVLDTKVADIFGGSWSDVLRYAVSIGFKLSEIDTAVVEMVKHDHNAAHFGGGRGFIFTFKKDFSHGKKAS